MGARTFEGIPINSILFSFPLKGSSTIFDAFFLNFEIKIEIFCVIFVAYVLPEFVTLIFNYDSIWKIGVFRVDCFSFEIKA